MKKTLIVLCLVLTSLSNGFSKEISGDSIIINPSFELVLDKQLLTNIKDINSSLHNISTNISVRSISDSILAGKPYQLILDEQTINKIESINSNLTQLTKKDTLLGLSWDVLATLIITLFIFFLGYVINSFIKKIR